MKRVLATLALSAVLSGCDLFGSEPDPTIRATGTVVLDETGAPVEGLGVALLAVPPSFGGAAAVATTRTDAAGGFALRYDVPQGSGSRTNYTYSVEVNNEPYNSQYSVFRRAATPGEAYDFGVIELSRIED